MRYEDYWSPGASDFYKIGEGFMEEGNFKMRGIAFHQLNEMRSIKEQKEVKYGGISYKILKIKKNSANGSSLQNNAKIECMYYHYLPVLIFLFPLASYHIKLHDNFMAKVNHIHLNFTGIDNQN